MAKDSSHDTEGETVKVLLELLRRVDREVKSTSELDKAAIEANALYDALTKQLAPGRLAGDEYFRVREQWTPKTGNRPT